MKNQVWLVLFIGIFLNAQSINIGNFYYRDYLDFGQNKGGFASGNSTLTGKDGTTLSVPNVPNFQASSNYGSLTSVGRGFGVTANHVTNVIGAEGTRKFGLTDYKIAKNDKAVSGSYGWDSKFIRLDKYVVEGEVGLLNINNSLEINADTTTKENNLKALQTELDNNFKDSEGNIYLYQAGTGEVTLYNTKNQTSIKEPLSDGSMKGGGFGTLEALQYGKCETCKDTNTQGMVFNYVPDDSFANIITEGDSGSGFYAYDIKNGKWVLLGVVSQTFVQLGGNEAKGSFVSQSDLEKFKEEFEKKIDLSASASWTMDYQGLTSTSNNFNGFKENADIIFSGNGTINIEVKSNIQRINENKDNGNVLNSGGFVFADTTNKTTYKFTNENGKTYSFKGSGLDIGENVELEWHLRNESGDALHKVGKGTLIVKTNYTPKDNENLGYLKLGEGKVVLDTDKKAFEGIYITSGRGSVELKQAEAIGATKNTTARSDTQALSKSYTLAQSTNTDMGFYFGTGGGLFDLSGNSLKLNTVAANDNKAIITNSSTSAVDFEIEGFGYGAEGKKDNKKANTIIHASFGERGKAANLNLITQSNTKTNDAHLIFDGDINISGSLKSTNSNIVLQGHPTAHATISDDEKGKEIIEKIKNAESGTQKPMPDYMDLTKPSSLKQPDWDSRTFEIKQGIDLKGSTLTIGKAANVIADIEADKDSKINFGGKHFIDEKDTKNITGSGFGFYQLITSGDLNDDESYKDSSYSGKITANGTQITSKFFNFAPNLDLKNKASLNATSLTISDSSDIKLNNSTLTTQNLTIKGMTNLNNDKIKLESNATFEVKESFVFDNSTFDLDSLKSNSLTLPTEYNLAGLNKSTITTNSEFKNNKENAQLFLDDSNFTAKNVSFTGANANVFLQNNARFTAEKLDFSQNANIILSNKAEMNLTSLDLKAQGGLFLDKESKLTLTSTLQGKDMNVSLNDKSTFTTSSDFTASNLTLFLQNESKFNAKTLTAEGKINISSDENSTLTLDTLELKNGTANINAKATITTLNLSNISEAFVGSNATLTNLNLTKSTANIANLADSAKVELKDSSVLYLNGELSNQNFTLTNSTLHLNSLNLNDKFTLTGDESSKTYLKRLSFDASNTTKTNIQSNIAISESLTLKNVGQNLGTTQDNDEALKKDLLALEFGKELDLQGTKIDISFADNVTKNDNESKLKFDEFYTIFSAQKLTHSNVSVIFNPEKFGNIFMQGKFENNSYLIQFLKENPRNFDKLKENTDTQYWDLLEILLQHDKNDESIDKAIANTNDKTALNTRLAGLQKSFESLAATDEGVLKTLPLLQKQDINARIQQNRFTRAKFVFNDTLTRSDFLPTLLKFVEDERKNRAWSSAGASYFTHKDSKFTLQSVNLGYDRKLLNDELLLGVMAGLTQTQLNSNIMSLNPQIYTFALYSDMLFNGGQMQNELSFSLLNGDKSFENETSSYKSFHSFFESLYKFDFTKQIKPLVLARVNLSSVDDFSTPIYKQKGFDDISLDLGLGVEWLVEKENGFYSATFIAQRDIFHSQKEVAVSLTNASKFINYKTNEPSFSYQLYLSGLENFSNGLFFRYALSAYIDSKTYKGVKGDIGLGYRF